MGVPVDSSAAPRTGFAKQGAQAAVLPYGSSYTIMKQVGAKSSENRSRYLPAVTSESADTVARCSAPRTGFAVFCLWCGAPTFL